MAAVAIFWFPSVGARARTAAITASAAIVSVVVGIVVTWAGVNGSVYLVKGGSMSPTFNDDDAVFASHVPFADLALGDVIVFDKTFEGLDRTYIHRIVEINEDGERTVMTKGDYNELSLKGVDYPITESDCVGKMLFMIPYGGTVAKVLAPPTNYIMLAMLGLLVFWLKEKLFLIPKSGGLSA
jgi:signal peptidase